MRTCICINRAYGVDGGAVAGELARIMNMPVFDSELTELAAKAVGMDPELLFQNDREKINAWLEAHFNDSSASEDKLPGDYAGDSPKEIMIHAMEQTIAKVCRKQNCIILGKGADHVLKRIPDIRAVSVFISAPYRYRLKSVMAREELTEVLAKIRIRKIDSLRSDFFSYYVPEEMEPVNGRWGGADAYDLCFNAEAMPAETMAEIIAFYCRRQFF